MAGECHKFSLAEEHQQQQQPTLQSSDDKLQPSAETDYSLIVALDKIKEYSNSNNESDRQTAIRLVQNILRNATLDVLHSGGNTIVEIVTTLAAEVAITSNANTSVTIDLLKAIPNVLEAVLHTSIPNNSGCDEEEGSDTFVNDECPLKTSVDDVLLPLIVSCVMDGNSGPSDSSSINNATMTATVTDLLADNEVVTVAKDVLLRLLDRKLLTNEQIDRSVCPAVILLSANHRQGDEDIRITSISFLVDVAMLIDRDLTLTHLLPHFIQLCHSEKVHLRDACALHFMQFCSVLAAEDIEKFLLPCYVSLCADKFWNVRKNCAESIAILSMYCRPEVRNITLAVIFKDFLRDEVRFVQRCAYHVLGAFIATFAEPSIMRVQCRCTGDSSRLVLLDQNDNEFNCSGPNLLDLTFCRPLCDKLNSAVHNEVVLRKGDSLEVLNGDDDDRCRLLNNTQMTNCDVSQEQTTCTNSSNHIDESSSNCDMKNGVAYNDVVTSFADIDLNSSGDCCSRPKIAIDTSSDNNVNQSAISRVVTNGDNCALVGQTENGGDNDDKNVSFNWLENKDQSIANSGATANDKTDCSSNSESDDDDESIKLFNSYNYWYITPDMPVELLYDANDTDNLSPISVNSTFFIDDSVTYEDVQPSSIVERTFSVNHNCDNLPKTLEAICPLPLIANYLSMTDPSLALSIDTNLAYHCAYSLPSVILTVGLVHWPVVRATVEKLATYIEFQVRRIIAASLHELAAILGTQRTTTDLMPVFDGFLKDLDEVRVRTLQTFAKFMYWVQPDKRLAYVSHLVEFNKNANWRIRHEVAQQCCLMLPLLKTDDLTAFITLCDALMDDKAADVRHVAINLVTDMVVHLKQRPKLKIDLLLYLIDRYVNSVKWRRRQTFAQLCSRLLQAQVVTDSEFAALLLPHLLDLSWDSVPNVRLLVAQTIARHIRDNSFYHSTSCPHHDNLWSVVRNLHEDQDRDVKDAIQS